MPVCEQGEHHADPQQPSLIAAEANFAFTFPVCSECSKEKPAIVPFTCDSLLTQEMCQVEGRALSVFFSALLPLLVAAHNPRCYSSFSESQELGSYMAGHCLSERSDFCWKYKGKMIENEGAFVHCMCSTKCVFSTPNAASRWNGRTLSSS